jgi:hypothetical protein
MQENAIAGLLFRSVTGMPRLTLALVVLALLALAAAMSYTGFLVVGALADLLGTSRFLAGLLLGALFARFPSIRQGKLRLVGLLPALARRPLILTLLALCLVRFVMAGAYVPALFTGFTTTFVLVYPWLKKIVLARIAASVMRFAAGGRGAARIDDKVIEGEFREKKG